MKIGSIHIKYWSRNNGVVSVISSTYESPVTFTKDNIQEDSELLQRLQEAKEGRSLRWQSSHQVIYVFFDVRPKDDDPEILEAYNIIGITEMSQDDFLAKISADEYRIMLQNLLRDKAEILPLLKAYPLAAKRDPPIIQLYNPEALKGLKWFFQHPENFQLFWTNLQNEKARRELALFADTDFLYEHLEYLDNSRLKDYIININWNDFTHTTLALRQKILPALTWTEHKDIAQEIILGMDRDGTLLDLNIGKCLPDITLVKLIIYISNQKNLLLTHENEINELLDYYSKDNNLILTALLKFCTILYYQEFTEKQCAFEAADAILMSYFWHESIMQSKGIPACLDILLDKCRHYYGKDAYCDARFIYKKGEEGQRQAKVWCPINFRGYCMCFNSTDLENHDLIEQKPAFQQTFSNFLCNVCDSFSPNITK